MFKSEKLDGENDDFNPNLATMCSVMENIVGCGGLEH